MKQGPCPTPTHPTPAGLLGVQEADAARVVGWAQATIQACSGLATP